MSDVDQVETLVEYSDNGAVATEPEKFTVSLPALDDREGLQETLTVLQQNREKRGVKMLAKWIDKYLMHQSFCDEMWSRAVNAASYVNGVRSATQKIGDKKRSLRYDAEEFYNAMTTPMLRLHCKLFELDYDSFNSVEEVVDQLVQKHLDMVGS